MFRLSKKKAVAAAVVAATAVGGGLAYAYWSSTGTGSGSATVGTSTAFVVASLPATGGPLTPGGPSETIAFTVTNPSTGSQKLNSVVASVANSDGSTWSSVAGCSAADFTVGTPSITYGQITAGGTVSGSVTVSMNNLSTNQDGCKLATVPIYFVAS
jgi:hypothetical protein